MPQHNLEHIFRSISTSRRRGIPAAPELATGISGSGADLSASLSRAGTEIAQLRAGYQQQADLIKANTQAVQSNTAGKGTHSALGSAVSGLFGGTLGLLSPIISGIRSLFGGGGTPAASLPLYTPPPPVSISGILHAGAPSAAPQTAPGPAGQTQQSSAPASYSPQITVHVNAMDSQSFMDRSGDIANAVREAMLNNHPINGVVAEL